jgi:hypothetical protein
MPEKLFMVYLNGTQDPMDLAYQQPVRASRVEVSEDSLGFYAADGTLSAFFDLSAVHSWREIDESELLTNCVGPGTNISGLRTNQDLRPNRLENSDILPNGLAEVQIFLPSTA